jgi:hypothetical protein
MPSDCKNAISSLLLFNFGTLVILGRTTFTGFASILISSFVSVGAVLAVSSAVIKIPDYPNF